VHFFWCISTPQIQNSRDWTKNGVVQAKSNFKQPNTTNCPNLGSLQPSKAELEQPYFWSNFSKILDLGPYNINQTAGSVWLCLKKW